MLVVREKHSWRLGYSTWATSTPQVAARLRQWPVGGAARLVARGWVDFDGGDVSISVFRGTVERDIDAVAFLVTDVYARRRQWMRTLHPERSSNGGAVSPSPRDRSGEVEIHHFGAEQATFMQVAQKPLEAVLGELSRDPELELLSESILGRPPDARLGFCLLVGLRLS